eukprot:4956265-Pyramimonas_sp.AAC.1
MNFLTHDFFSISQGVFLGLPDGVQVDGVRGSRRIADASPGRLDVHHGARLSLRRRRRCIGELAQSSDPVYSDPV